MNFLDSIKNHSKHLSDPFPHWEFSNPLTTNMIDEIYNTEIDDPTRYEINYDGTRAIDGGDGKFREGITDGGKALKFRCFVEKHNNRQFPELFNLVQELQSKETYQYIGSLINRDLSKSFVRLEVICDRKGFWLKPHCDIKEKLLSCLLFVNRFGESEELGTDFYNSKLELVKTVPYRNNYGYFFSSDENSWHGMEKKIIQKDRRCIQINYVTFETDWKVE
tara:strand:+ start:202 stop:864 length:663 start_codon:yes stop_codon:yes gene_type:complete